jgi:hypothetical protein
MKSFSNIRPQTFAMIKSYLRSLVETGLINSKEEKEILVQLKHMSEKGGPLPEKITLKLIDQREAASLRISLIAIKEKALTASSNPTRKHTTQSKS